jgi:putative transposase
MADKRQVITVMKDDYPVIQLCEALDCARSSYYYQSVRQEDDPDLIEEVEHMLMRWPFYGYRRVTAQLKRQGWSVGETVVRRLLKTLSVTRNVGRVRVRTTDSNHNLRRYPNLVRNLTPAWPDQVWVADITYIRLGLQFIYLAVILDAYTRAVRGWHLSRNLSQGLTRAALRMALTKGIPSVHHSDQGAQYAAGDYINLLRSVDAQISMADAGQPTQNGLVERFIRTLKEEHVDYTEYTDFDDARQQIGHWLDVEYMTERIHSALDYATPAEFEAAARAAQAAPSLIYP